MPIQTSLWKVGAAPQELRQSILESEKLLEEMIVASPRMLSDEWMIIGRQESTGYGGIIDLLAIAPDSSLVLIELKRDKTPRDVVAQSLDYASWVERLQPQDISAIYARYSDGKNLATEFNSKFGTSLDEDNLNSSHQIIIVASSLDASTERIIGYLSDRDIPINVLCFQVFASENGQYISRSWLIDPAETQVNAVARPDAHAEPWNGEFYHSFGDGSERSWVDAVEYGFICAGGGSWYSRTLQLLAPGDRVWVKIPGAGFVGVAKVLGRLEPAKSFEVNTPNGMRSVLDVAKRAGYHKQFADDPQKCEYFVPVKWLQTVPIQDAVQEVGMFGNQNSICKPTAPRWRQTVDRLKEIFTKYE
ncbi:MAG: hypothetical protein RIQ55_1299 [Pseudomonadota bacterium]|jgi:hypothetical protein